MTDAQLKKVLHGALRMQITAHGPITKEWLGSTTKRIVTAIRNWEKQNDSQRKDQ